MEKFTLIIFIYFFCFSIFSQDRDLERSFENRRSEIKDCRIKVLNEYKSTGFFGVLNCSDEKEQTKSYKFDEEGNLIAFFEFIRGGTPYKSTSYRYNSEGEYIYKKYSFLDSTGKVTKERIWKFEYRDKQKTNEFLTSSSGDTILTNSLEYDDEGNLSSLIRDNRYKWTFVYNDNRQVLERKEWTIYSDSAKCTKRITYSYNNNGLLLSKTERNPNDSSDIWVENKFTYNKDNKIRSEYEKKTIWVISGDKNKEVKYWIYNYEYKYDDNGNLIKKSKYMKKQEGEIVFCEHFEYEYFD